MRRRMRTYVATAPPSVKAAHHLAFARMFRMLGLYADAMPAALLAVAWGPSNGLRLARGGLRTALRALRN